MVEDELIDSQVSLIQCKQAVEALHTHALKREQKLQESELLPGKEPNVWLNVTVKKIPPGHKFKPVKIPIVYPLVDPRTTPICLITKDPQREYKDLLEAQNIKFISRVVGIEKLKGKFKPFEARRMLLKENGLFLADERIVPLLPKLLGVKWFEAKKQPIPVCLKRKDLKGELERAISSTYMNQNKGTCTSIKVGTLSQKPSQILANIKMALPAVGKNIYGGWENIQAFHIKTNSSVSLPIWSCNLDENEGGRWNGLTAVSDDEEDGSHERSDEEEMEVGVVETKKAALKGKKRAQEDEESEKPKKKAKRAEGKALAESVVVTSKVSGKTPISPSTSAKPISASTDAPLKTRKRKSLGSESLPTPSSPSVTESTAKAAGTSETTKKRRQKSIPSSDVVSPTPDIPAPSAPDKKKGKAVVVPEPGPTSISTEDLNTRKKKARTTTGKDLADEHTPDSASSFSKEILLRKKQGKRTETTIVQPTVVETVVDGNDKKKKKAADAAVAEPSAAPAASLTKDEMKQKRSTGVGEKKKIKMVKTMGGKSAKDRVLGKKAAQG